MDCHHNSGNCMLTWAFMDQKQIFGRFVESTPYIGYYYYMSITMVFGSLLAGATSEGGGAVAFPVMTLGLGVPTIMARDFSFAIQSFGMSCASVVIFFLKVPLDNEALIWSSIGGLIGLLIGLEGIAPFLPPAYAKLFFVSLWLSFAVALFKLNQRKERRVYDNAKESDLFIFYNRVKNPHSSVQSHDENKDTNTLSDEKELNRKEKKRIAVLIGIGIFGGICSSIAGSGLDMATFSILTLYYRVSEKIATPTSVVLMAINAVIGTLCRLVPIGGQYAPGEEETLWKFVSVCIPIVVIGAPVGAHIPTILSRHQISYIVYFLSILQFIMAYAIIKPWSKNPPHGVGLIVSSAITVFGGSFYFNKVADFGEIRDAENESKCSNETEDLEQCFDDTKDATDTNIAENK